MSAHIIGRPGDDLLVILFGQGAEPERAFIGAQVQGSESDTLEKLGPSGPEGPPGAGR